VVLNLKIKEMNHLEKFVFLEITWRQFGNLDFQEHSKTYELLSQNEKDLAVKLSSEIHNIFNYLNSNFDKNKLVSSIEDYNQLISPVSYIILEVSKDFQLTLKREVSDTFKNAFCKIFGIEKLNLFLKTINC
jgi:hypothetical protein